MAKLNVTGKITSEGKEVVTIIQKTSNAIKLSNGLILNWGDVTPAKSGTTVTLQIPFSTTSYSVGATNRTISSNQIKSLAVTEYNTTNFVCYGQYSQSNSGLTGGDVPFRWIAAGF